MQLRAQQDEVSSRRKMQVGSGDRSEKIRTYNYKDNRLTEHRLAENFALSSVVEGVLEPIIQACIAADQKEKLEALAQS
jgi:peptide chain release factor 1